MDDNVLEGDLWLDSVTGDVYRATPIDPWANDGSWHTWGTVLWKVIDDVLMVQPAEGDTGTLGEPVTAYYSQYAPWGLTENNPSVSSMTSVRSKGAIAMNANSRALFDGSSSLTDLSPISNWDVSGVTDMCGMFSDCDSLTAAPPISGWDVSNVTNMCDMFYNCDSLTDLSSLSNWDTSGVTAMDNMFTYCDSLSDISPLSNWDTSGVTSMYNMFQNCPLERIGVPSLAHGGRNFVSKLKSASVVTNMDTTMLTNTTTGETMSANQILTDMDTNPSKYATGTVWTL